VNKSRHEFDGADTPASRRRITLANLEPQGRGFVVLKSAGRFRLTESP